ncbi:MAG: hypothetical protein R3E79_33660 [Caldilineaceae bacterium]
MIRRKHWRYGVGYSLPGVRVACAAALSRALVQPFWAGAAGSSGGAFAQNTDLTFDVPLRTVIAGRRTNRGGRRAGSAFFTLEIILNDDIIDVCIGEQRCLINRPPELHADASFSSVKTGCSLW